MNTATLNTPTRDDAGRGSLAHNPLARWLGRILAPVLERVAPHAERAGAADPSVIEDVRKLRRLADSYLRNDPSFAADLYAAADRCEVELEAAQA
jgi:hypothetical protein